MICLLLCPPLLGDAVSDLRPAIRKSSVAHAVDPVLVEAVIRYETGNGKSKAARQKHNYGGLMRKRGGLQRFNSPEEGVESVAALLGRYRDRGMTSVESISRKYCKHNARRWVRNVNSYRGSIVAGKYGVWEEPEKERGSGSGSWFSQNAPQSGK